MSRVLMTVVAIFLAYSAHAGPGDGPIVPWPLDNHLQRISHSELEGEWIAYGTHLTMMVSIGKVQANSYHPVQISNVSLPQGAIEYVGIIWNLSRGYTGKVRLKNGSIQQQVIIFRADPDGLTLRVAAPNGSFEDLHMVRK